MSLFPFLFGGTFIEACKNLCKSVVELKFPFLFGGTFIEALLSCCYIGVNPAISLPFRRDFH